MFSLPRWAKEIAQELRAFVGLAENLGLIPKTHGGSQTSVISVPGDSMPTSAFCEHKACIWYINIPLGKTNIKGINSSFKEVLLMPLLSHFPSTQR